LVGAAGAAVGAGGAAGEHAVNATRPHIKRLHRRSFTAFHLPSSLKNRPSHIRTQNSDIS
jgi:hypothetical protein